ISYTQAFLDIPVYGTNVKINIDKNGRVNSILFKLAQTQHWAKTQFTALPDNQKIKNVIGNYTIAKADKYWYFDGENVQPSFLVDYGLTDGSKHEEVILSADYNILYLIDKHRYEGVKDTMATANVFFPDPLTSARKPYGAPFVNADDSAIFALDYERVPMQFPVSFENDTFFLLNKYIQMEDFSAPKTQPVYSKTPFFNYSRQHTSFEEVNIMFHVYNYRQHIKKIGFDTLGKFRIKADAHGLDGSDNSQFDFFQNDLKLVFGDGGIDDAEDADVIVHEYSHFLSYAAGGDNAYGSDRLAIEEGMGDYFACSYSKNISNYNWQKVYSWDGNDTWDGRSCVTSKNYKNDLSGNKYRDGEIWVGTLMEIQDEIGRDQTDALMLGTLYLLSKYITMPNAARLFIHSDSLMNDGRNFNIIAGKFVKNGLLPATYISVGEDITRQSNTKVNSAYFQSHNLVYVDFEKQQSGFVKLIDIQGKEIIVQNFNNTNKVNIYAPTLKPGMYILHISANGVQQSVKLMK
ncbi:MAG: T9SS type A sorting domain-containing protein, partial [Bacteroidia bacterium]